MRPEQIELLVTPGTPTIHPEGSRVVVATSRPSLAADAYVGQLLALTLGGDGPTTPQRLTQGRHDSAPRYSPDGRLVGFLRADGGPAQLALMNADGGEPRVVTDRLLGVSDFAFSPDSRHVVLVSREPEAGRYGSLDGVGPAAEDPRLITGHRYQANGVGYTRDRPAQLFLLELPDLDAEPPVEPTGRAKDAAAKAGTEDQHRTVPALQQLTDGIADHRVPVFAPDGRTVYFVAALHPTQDTDLRVGVYATDTTGAAPRLVTAGAPDLAAASVAPTPDGRALYVLASDTGSDGQDFVARNPAVYLADLDADGVATTAPRRLTDPETMDPSGGDGRLVPTGDGGVLVVVNARGRGELVHVDGGAGVRTLHSGDDVVTGVAAAAGRIVVTVSSPTSAGDLAQLVDDGTDTGLRTLTDLSAPLRSATEVIVPVERTVTAADGYPVHGWVLVPSGPGPHPVLLNIHGGPYAQYGWNLFDEAQVYAEAGYAVVMCNPRGSAGYGQEHGRSIRQAMGTVDASDVLTFLEGAVDADPALDGTRLGVMGGSYGGFLTAWLIAHDHRFAGAVVERGFLDPDGFAGTSDIGSFFGHEYVGRDPEAMRAQSPLAVADQVRTPTLVIHSEQDLRCPLPQAQRYFERLLDAGVDAQLLVFPGENHELSRSGTPWHRVQRFEAILRFWQRRLPVTAS
ncbi:dipeptidyl aminopeptidase [Tersicoccus solisilvae]|uniref:Dipeptidyl aminopeptidase n=1 Tax=Tersicoccus solisilvae TaxID=1882339 RepID=A0ABQ1NSG1_9MICC|nr:S9 family peptidase [Tersicoccus solisilvae]GGC83531.1 dipeptidyl aminopeptidase [Tersicoccus solisilvae]